MAKTKLKTVYKIKWKNLLKVIIILLILIGFMFLILKLVSIYNDYSNTTKMIKNIEEKVQITNVVDSDDTVIIEPEDEISKFDSYWNYIKLSMIELDLAPLKKINSNVIGWIEVKGTDINYPVLQSTDNTYYKTHSFDKSENSNGWIYLNSQNSTTLLDTNTIIYGNNSYNTLFGNLKTLFKESWQSNDNNYIIKYTTDAFTSLWQIISVYKTSSDIDTISFDNTSDYESYLNQIMEKSILTSKSVNTSDKILTLKALGNNENIVVTAKLLKVKGEPIQE